MNDFTFPPLCQKLPTMRPDTRLFKARKASSLQLKMGGLSNVKSYAILVPTLLLIVWILGVFFGLTPTALVGTTAASIRRGHHSQRDTALLQEEHQTAKLLSNDMNYFIQAKDGKFVYGPECKRFYVSGWNSWELVESAAGALQLFGASLPDSITGPELVRKLLDRAAENKLNVLRTWAHTVSPQYALELSPGEYSEAAFRGLDYLLNEARKRGIRVLLVLIDNWSETNGVDQIVKWAGQSVHEAFFSDPVAKTLYKNRMTTILKRVNSITGVPYANDPTIFGWNLISEPRCYKCGDILKVWIDEMAAHFRTLDTNHMLTVGEEGFYPEGVEQSAANPQGLDSWAFEEGQHFPRDHSSPDIDFMAIHIWGQNWADTSPEFTKTWLKQHVMDAKALNRPLLLEEYGCWGYGQYEVSREYWYATILDIVLEEAETDSPMMGAMFWQWFYEGQKAPEEEGGGAGGIFGVFESDPTFMMIRNFSFAMATLSGTATDGICKPLKADILPKLCDQPGREGPNCSLEINECARHTDTCDENAGCIDVPGGYRCSCYPGFEGNGISCRALGTAGNIESLYVTAGEGKLACREGDPVLYPRGAPGYAQDVFEESNVNSPSGSQVPVTSKDCMTACEIADSCDSFAYNPVQRKCFLKTGADPGHVCESQDTLCVNGRGKIYSCGYWQTYFKRGLKSGDDHDLKEEKNERLESLRRSYGGGHEVQTFDATDG